MTAEPGDLDNVTAVHEKLIAMGEKEYEPLTKRAEAGFITTSVDLLIRVESL